MNTNIKRTMFHEIGHYTARQLNYKICKNGFGVKEINFKAKNLKDDNTEFEGQTVANKP
jgi:hypothetical protein